ncbi:MAG: TIGR00341 family protein, partial [Ignavibacterium sp.]
SQLALYSRNQFNVEEISKEAKALFNNISEISVHRSFVMDFKSNKIDTVTFGYVKFSSGISTSERTKLNNWLKERTNSDKFRLIVN